MDPRLSLQSRWAGRPLNRLPFLKHRPQVWGKVRSSQRPRVFGSQAKAGPGLGGRGGSRLWCGATPLCPDGQPPHPHPGWLTPPLRSLQPLTPGQASLHPVFAQCTARVQEQSQGPAPGARAGPRPASRWLQQALGPCPKRGAAPSTAASAPGRVWCRCLSGLAPCWDRGRSEACRCSLPPRCSPLHPHRLAASRIRSSGTHSSSVPPLRGAFPLHRSGLTHLHDLTAQMER